MTSSGEKRGRAIVCFDVPCGRNYTRMLEATHRATADQIWPRIKWVDLCIESGASGNPSATSV